MAKDTAKVKGQIEGAALEQLQNQYPKMYEVRFQNHYTNEWALVYMKKETREVYAQASKLSVNKDELTVAEYLLRNLRVGGMDTEEIVNDIDWLKNFAATVLQILFVKVGELKKN